MERESQGTDGDVLRLYIHIQGTNMTICRVDAVGERLVMTNAEIDCPVATILTHITASTYA